VTFNGVTATLGPWSDTSITASVPASATPGNVVVTTGDYNLSSPGFQFTPLLPTISGTSAGGRGETVTVTGTGFCTPAGTLAINGASATVTGWNDNSITAYVPDTATASGSVFVTTNNGRTSAGAGFTVNPPALASIAPTQGIAGQLVTLSGSGMGMLPLPDNSNVKFGATPANVTLWSPGSITVSVPSGLADGTVQVVATIDGIPSNALNFVVSNPMLLSPNQMTLVVGETQPLQALNSDGTPLTGVSWSVDNPSIADFADDGLGNFTLTANAAGQAVLTATSGTRSGTAAVTVIQLSAGESLPAGTVKWSSPPLGTGAVTNIIQSRKVDEATPDFYVQETQFAYPFSAFRLRAMTADGRQLWSRPGDELAIAGDNDGGVLAESFDPGVGLLSIAKDGTERWRSAVNFDRIEFKHAIHPDGTIFIAKVTDNVTRLWLTALDGTTGLEKFSVPLPSGTIITTIGQRTYLSQNYRDANGNPTLRTVCDNSTSTTSGSTLPDLGGIVIDETATAYLPYATRNITYTRTCTFQPEWIPNPPNAPIHNVDLDGNLLVATETWAYSVNASVGLAKATSAAALPLQTVNTFSGSGSGTPSDTDPSVRGFDVTEAIIPDGHGGVLFGGFNHANVPVIFRSTQAVLTSSVGSVGQMLLGENDTIFVSGSGGTAAMTLDGSPRWQRQGGTPIAALNDGSVLLQSNTLTRVDAAGAVSDFVGGAFTDPPTYLGGDLWATATSAGALGLLSDGPPNATLAAAQWWFSSAPGALVLGNPQQQNTKPTLFERPPTHSQFINVCQGTTNCLNATNANYNAIELLTDKTPQEVFDLYVLTFAERLKDNTISALTDDTTTPVSAVGNQVTFRLLKKEGLLGGFKAWAVDPFTVSVKRYDPSSHLFSIVTMSNHPLAGWRYWKTYQNGPGGVVIETGAVDTCIGFKACTGGYFAGSDQVTIWHDYLTHIKDALSVQRVSDPNFGDDRLNGVWNGSVDREYILTNICGPGPGGFCRP
jgi:hypothetical protein